MATTNAWDAVLLLRKDTVNREPDVQPGVQLGTVNVLALLKMAEQHPSMDVLSIPFTPIEEVDYDGEDIFY